MICCCRYEEEIARLKRGDEIAEDHRPLLPSSTAGQVALAGLNNNGIGIIGEKRTSSNVNSLSIFEDQRNVRMRDNSMTGGAIGDIATAAMASASSMSTTSSSIPSVNPTNVNVNSPAYDWIVTYNPKAQRLLSIDLLQSISFSGVVCCVRFSNSGHLLAASGNKLCNIYDVRTGKRVLSLPHDSIDGGDLYVRALSFNSSDTLFAAGSEDNSIRVWDISKLAKNGEIKLIQTLKGHSQEVYALEFVDEERIVSGSGDQSLKLWNVLAGECLASIQSKLPEHLVSETPQRESGITSLSISKNRKQIVTGSLDRLVRVYELVEDDSIRMSEEDEGENENDGDGDGDDKDFNGKDSEMDMEFKLIETFEGHEDSVYSVTFDSSDSNVISGSLDKTIRKWSFSPEPENESKCLQIIPNHRDFVLSVAVSHQKQHGKRPFIISGSKDRTVQIWDEIGQCNQLTLQGHKNSVISVAISPTGGVFATGSGDGTARIWAFTNKSD